MTQCPALIQGSAGIGQWRCQNHEPCSGHEAPPKADTIGDWILPASNRDAAGAQEGKGTPAVGNVEHATGVQVLREPSDRLRANGDQEPCLTLEFRDSVCEHCLEDTTDPSAPHYYDNNHEPAVVRGTAWAIWCAKSCDDECTHAGLRTPLFRRGNLDNAIRSEETIILQDEGLGDACFFEEAGNGK
ncbi:MAG: hypothetical protein ABR562_05575 [Thermoplasmatota archaeon]